MKDLYTLASDGCPGRVRGTGVGRYPSYAVTCRFLRLALYRQIFHQPRQYPAVSRGIPAIRIRARGAGISLREQPRIARACSIAAGDLLDRPRKFLPEFHLPGVQSA